MRSGSVAPAPKPQLAQPDSKLTEPCAKPVDATKGKAEDLWIQDRIALVECGAGKKALGGFYADRDARLMGTTK